MCGIAGIFAYGEDKFVNKNSLIKARDLLSHRGPDGAGIWISQDKKIGLAHRRLSIIDLSVIANQPMSNEDGTIWISFNGEIYNHQEIKPELEKRGHRFKTDHSDTEVIIHAFEEWGIDCVQKFRGMFAFAIWDNRQKELWLVRDRVGIKPLYFSDVDKNFIFASEIKSLLFQNSLLKTIDHESIYHYLTFLTVPAPKTMFKYVYKVEAGTIIRINNKGEIHKTRYWNPSDFLNNPLSIAQSSDAVFATENLLKDAVLMRMISDVPVSGTFSGGVDSSLIMAMMKEGSDNISAVNLDYGVESQYSESKLAREMADKLKINLFSKKISSDEYINALKEFLNIQIDYPVGDLNGVLLYVISKIEKKTGKTVTLIGEGGDEIGGYPVYINLDREYKILNFFCFLPEFIKKIIYKISPRKIKNKIGLAMGKSVISRRHIHAFDEEEKRKMWIGKTAESSYSIMGLLMDEIKIDSHDKFLRKILNVEFKLRLPELILPRVDYPTMANAIEARVPFLDHKLVEYSLRLPMKIKMKDGQAKYILKKILCKYVDKDYVYRKKIGFGMLLNPFLNEVLPEKFKNEILDNISHPLFLYLDRKYLLDLYNNHKKIGNAEYKIWAIYALSKWLEGVSQI